MYIRPIIEHGCVIYRPSLIHDINAIERIQKYFTRRLFSAKNRPNYAERLNKLDLEPLELRMIHIDLFTLYKILNGTLIVPSLVFEPSYSNRQSTCKRLFVHNLKSNIRKNFFHHRVIQLWNSFSKSITVSVSFSSFKRLVCSHDFIDLLKGCASKAGTAVRATKEP